MTYRIRTPDWRSKLTFTVAVPYATCMRNIEQQVFGQPDRESGMWPVGDNERQIEQFGWIFKNFRRFSGRGMLEAQDNLHTRVTLVLDMPLFFTNMIPAIFKITAVLIVSWFSFFLLLLGLLLFESPLAPLFGALTAMHPPLLVLMPFVSDGIYRAGARRLFRRILTQGAGTDDEQRMVADQSYRPPVQVRDAGEPEKSPAKRFSTDS